MTIKEFSIRFVGLVQASKIEVVDFENLNVLAEFHESDTEWAITKFRRSSIFEYRELTWVDVLLINNKIVVRIAIRG